MGKLFKIALGLFLLGVGVVAIFSIASETNLFAAVNEEDFIYHELMYDADEFSKFDFDFDHRDFHIEASEDDSIVITYWTTDKDPVTVTESSGTLKLVNEVKWYDQIFIGWNFFSNAEYYDLHLSLPTSVIYELYLVNASGDVNISDLDNFSDVYVHTSSGRLALDSVEADAVDLHTSSGGITVANLVAADDVKIGTSSGVISVTNVTADGSLDIDTSSGGISVTEVTATGDMDIDTSSGVITVNDVTITGDLEMFTSSGGLALDHVTANSIDGDCSSGGITATYITSQSIDLYTSSGGIIVSINGEKDDYEVFMSTSLGIMVYDGLEVSQEHINDGAPYEVRLRTSSGGIHLDFND